MSQAESSNIETLQAEISQLKGELQLRDQLVEQLSQELFRLVKDNPNFTARNLESESESNQSQVERLKAQISEIEEQLQFYQAQLSTRDAEIYELQSRVQALTEQNHSLQEELENQPQLYRQKFYKHLEPVKNKLKQLQTENQQLHAQLQQMKPVKEKLKQLQAENQQLHTQLQNLHHRLSARSQAHSNNHVDLPNL